MSDKPSVSEILGYLDGEISHHKKRLESSVNFGWVDKAEVCRSHLKILEAIRALILASDKGPEVDDKAILYLLHLLIDKGPLWYREAMAEEGKTMDIISKWLVENGVRVKEAADER